MKGELPGIWLFEIRMESVSQAVGSWQLVLVGSFGLEFQRKGVCVRVGRERKKRKGKKREEKERKEGRKEMLAYLSDFYCSPQNLGPRTDLLPSANTECFQA